ncbi:MAG: CTP synthase [Patescibacteria group bacterium]
MKLIIVSGGVVSGLGKGVITSSLSFLLKSRGLKVTPCKIDMYFNVDAGTLRPQEHGEVFVTHDGMETDEDLGHYERFIHKNLAKENYITAGQIYQEVIRKERAFEYAGDTVDVIPHLTDEIIKRIRLAGEVNNADIVIVEFGGTVGEYKNGIFFEATRIFKLKHPDDLIHIHVTYLPYLAHIGELKTKPAQTSVHILNSLGIQPDIMIARSDLPVDQKRLDKLALFCNMHEDRVFTSPNLNSIYRVPLIFHKQKHHLATTCLDLLKIKSSKHQDIEQWKDMVVHLVKKHKKTIKVAMIGKYFVTGEYQLGDSYLSVIEALKHAAAKFDVNIDISWIDSEDFEKNPSDLDKFDGIIVPQGWGKRGTEGKIKAIEYIRKHNIPFLGLCFGMQMATIEFARHVLGLKDANSSEADENTKNPVIHIMKDQEKFLKEKQYGGTIRLGAWPCLIKKGTNLEKIYLKYGGSMENPWYQVNPSKLHKEKPIKGKLIFERHRHRYEFNKEYRDSFEKKGFVISGTSPDGNLVEAIEIPTHKFFVATQFHPEYISRPLTPHPIFLAFLESMIK